MLQGCGGGSSRPDSQSILLRAAPRRGGRGRGGELERREAADTAGPCSVTRRRRRGSGALIPTLQFLEPPEPGTGLRGGAAAETGGGREPIWGGERPERRGRQEGWIGGRGRCRAERAGWVTEEAKRLGVGGRSLPVEGALALSWGEWRLREGWGEKEGCEGGSEEGVPQSVLAPRAGSNAQPEGLGSCCALKGLQGRNQRGAGLRGRRRGSWRGERE